MTSHVLKTDTHPFHAMWRGKKFFEFRRNDREFKVGDWLTLKECDERGNRLQRRILGEVIYILRGPDFGVPLGFCVMQLEPKTMRHIEAAK